MAEVPRPASRKGERMFTPHRGEASLPLNNPGEGHQGHSLKGILSDKRCSIWGVCGVPLSGNKGTRNRRGVAFNRGYDLFAALSPLDVKRCPRNCHRLVRVVRNAVVDEVLGGLDSGGTGCRAPAVLAHQVPVQRENPPRAAQARCDDTAEPRPCVRCVPCAPCSFAAKVQGVSCGF